MGSTSDVGRRDLIKRAAALGLIAVPTMSTLAACASGGGDDDKKDAKGKKSKKNPLGVKADAAIEIHIFNGGFSDQYAKDAEKIYKSSYPKADVQHKAGQQIGRALQPRMAQGDPPDVINNSGDGNMDVQALLKNKQLEPLNDLMDAPSWDDPNKTVRETLVPGTAEMGQFGDDKVYVLYIAYGVYGVWYGNAMLKKLDVEYPKTWDAMLDVCKKAKAKGIAGWTYAGAHPRYVSFTMFPQICQVGGYEALKNIDNLEPNAWKSDAVKTVFEAYEELVAKGYVLKGSSSMDHTKSQQRWAEGKAVFIPNGNWLENESKKYIEDKKYWPDGMDLAIGATPSMTDSDKMPFGTLYAAAGEPFIIPSSAKNKAGAKEFMRIMYSKKSAQNFTKLVASIPATAGAADGMELKPGMTSSLEAIKNAGKNIIVPRFRDFYPELWTDDMNDVCGDLMEGKSTAKEAMDKMQKAADRVAKDDGIKKIKRSD
ncbi:N-acetylglucosamine/diacetylchitobiose ABC transporter substrate-binding protein [Streptomyces boninensis]|uniref:N-acetylglucosamine/diacetylchitobiose ABC transporter substrate-binding protein n=1 Tax=Streptomyces boninensis TaxID=2039455 RepID=UPI003B228F4C